MEGKKDYKGVALKLNLLCMITYLISYIGRKSFDSNVNEIMSYFGKEKSVVGIIGTFFFVSYAVGQVFHGVMSKRYSARWSIFIALTVSAITNVLFGIAPKGWFSLLKYVWLINGFANATLWSVMIRLLNAVLTKKHLEESLFIMSFPVATGTFIVYGLSALNSYLGNYKITFYVSGALLILIAFLWWVSVDSLSEKCKKEKIAEEGLIAEFKPEEKTDKTVNTNKNGEFYLIFVLLAFFAIINNFVKDGLMTWTPTILTEKYELENWLSVLLTIGLPLCAVLGANLAILLNRKIKDNVFLCGIQYILTMVVLAGLIIFLGNDGWIIPLICFMLISCIMSGVNNVITNIFPLNSPKGINAGLIAGVIDGFCYVGSAISSFGLGSIAESFGWNAVIYVFLALTVFATVVSLVYGFIKAIKTKRQKI